MSEIPPVMFQVSPEEEKLILRAVHELTREGRSLVEAYLLAGPKLARSSESVKYICERAGLGGRR